MQRNRQAMMQIALTTLVFAMFSIGLPAQPDPVQWSFWLDTSKSGLLQVNASADIDAGWKLYGHNIEAGGPIPTDLVIEKTDHISVSNEIDERGNIHGPETDGIFEVTVSYFTEKATFTRQFRTQNADAVSGYVLYMVCDDSRCLPPKEVPFTLKL